MRTLSDAFGRRINYLRISVTDRCNLRCAYCMPAEGVQWQPREELLSLGEIVQVVRAAAQLGVSRIRLTGGEPLVRPDVARLIAAISHIDGIQDIGLTTNGLLLEKLAPALADAGLSRVNISLDTLDQKAFRRLTRLGEFGQVWRGIAAAERAGLAPIKLNTVVIRGINDAELLDLARLSLDHPWHIRFIELMPIGNTGDWGAGFLSARDRYVSVQEMRQTLAPLDLLPAEAPAGNGPARTFRIPGAAGAVGFISPLGEHFCETCNRLRLTADGRLRPCLIQTGEVPVREALRGGQDVTTLIEQAAARKPEGHRLWQRDIAISHNRMMCQIGG
ncbi:MAG: GTP 3',8-cyclase MoaA [Chloroflexi bacterium]|nr:GTP 3',8-cyclase MoaA [Chloroflexota bacterium]MCL5276010.1 GTP 3',8-cyclase MoaA [Chloroflexota bacterium]